MADEEHPLVVPPADLRLQVELLGPDTSAEDDRYPKRETLAKLDVPVDGERGWTIYLDAVRGAIMGRPSLVLPVSEEDAARIREEFTRDRRTEG